jgi:EGF-like domain
MTVASMVACSWQGSISTTRYIVSSVNYAHKLFMASSTGPTCQSEVNECDSNPCLNGGTCIDRFNGFRCECDSGYIGQNCQDERQGVNSTFCLKIRVIFTDSGTNPYTRALSPISWHYQSQVVAAFLNN